MSLFTLGTMRALESPQRMEAVLMAALAAGINHIETAPAYGPAEAFLGAALRRLDARDPDSRSALVLTSKILPGFDPDEGREQLRASLRRLGAERLDNLAVHGLNRPEHLTWALKGPGAELLAWAQGEGLVGQVGFSSHGDTGLIAAALESGRFGFCSLHLHLFDRERLPLARAALAAGLGVMAISPADKGGRLHDPPAELERDCAPFDPLELAYRFLLAEGISTLTLGAAQPEDLGWAVRLAAAAGPLGADEAQALEQALARLEAAGRQRLGGSRCGQCRAVPALPQRCADPRPAAAAQPGGGPWHGALRPRALQPDRPGRPLVGGARCRRLPPLRRLPAPLSAAAAHSRPAGRHPPAPGGRARAAGSGVDRRRAQAPGRHRPRAPAGAGARRDREAAG